jgi:hypothetical protein
MPDININIGGIRKRATFTTNGSGNATVAALIGYDVDLFTNEPGSSNVLIHSSNYTYVKATGVFTMGLSFANSNFLAYGY